LLVSYITGGCALFLGQQSCELKNDRLLLPGAFRDVFQDTVYITQGFDCNLLILTKSAFEELYKHIVSLNIADPLARLLLRMILSTTSLEQITNEGEIPIPARLIRFADLKEKTIVVGQGDYCEIWSVKNWIEQQSQVENIEGNSQRFSTLIITTR